MTTRRNIVFGASGLVLAMTMLPSRAAAGAIDAPPNPPLTVACQACHGRDGISESGDIPNLAGQKQGYLVRQLEAFRSGERKNPLMAAVAGQLSDADIRALALAWSQTPGIGAAPRAPTTTLAIRSRMVFPAEFPKGFSVYETIDDAPGGQVVKRYANDLALRAAQEGKMLPHGAAIIVANHAVQLDASQQPVLDAEGRPVAAKVLSYAAMESGAGWGDGVPGLLRNGDWDYALFSANRLRRDTLNQAPCLACHKPIAADSHVFTLKAMRGFAIGPSAH